MKLDRLKLSAMLEKEVYRDLSGQKHEQLKEQDYKKEEHSRGRLKLRDT